MKEIPIQKKLENMGKYACYFLCLLKSFDHLDKILPCYDIFVGRGWMKEDCTIQDPVAIVEYLSGYKYTIKKTTELDKNADIKIAYYHNKSTSYYHFVLVDSSGKVIFDSLGTVESPSNTVKNGYVESYRLFYKHRSL